MRAGNIAVCHTACIAARRLASPILFLTLSAYEPTTLSRPRTSRPRRNGAAHIPEIRALDGVWRSAGGGCGVGLLDLVMKIGELNGWSFHVPTSGGKAGKGRNRTSTIQIFKNDTLKQFRFVVANPESRKSAMRKAKSFAVTSPLTRNP